MGQHVWHTSCRSSVPDGHALTALPPLLVAVTAGSGSCRGSKLDAEAPAPMAAVACASCNARNP